MDDAAFEKLSKPDEKEAALRQLDTDRRLREAFGLFLERNNYCDEECSIKCWE